MLHLFDCLFTIVCFFFLVEGTEGSLLANYWHACLADLCVTLYNYKDNYYCMFTL